MAFSIRIDSQKKVEFSLLQLNHTVQIAWFKGTIENILFLKIERRVHSFECPIKQCLFIKYICSQFFLNKAGLDNLPTIDFVFFERLSSLQLIPDFKGFSFVKGILFMNIQSVNGSWAEIMNPIRIIVI